MKYLKLVTFVIIVFFLFSCKKEQSVIKPEVKTGLKDSSIWAIRETLTIYTTIYDSLDGTFISNDSTIETFTHNVVIKTTTDSNIITIRNLEHNYPIPLNNSHFNSNNDVELQTYFFTLSNTTKTQYEYIVWSDFMYVTGIIGAWIEFNDSVKPTSFTGYGTMNISTYPINKIGYFTVVGIKL